jgi:hypothetical protein
MAFFSTLALLLLLACGRAKQPAFSAQPPVKNKEAPAAGEACYLENRIPDCDSALAFMRQVIVPVRSEPGPLNVRQSSRFREAFISVPGTGQGMTREQSKFYLNLDCLVGQPASMAFELFCTEESRAAFLSDSTFQKASEPAGMTLLVYGLWDFIVVIREGQVFRSAFAEQSTAP